jgi:DNA-binding response OmpR family regulator
MKPYRFTLADDDANMLFFMHRMLSQVFPDSSIASFSSAEDALKHIIHTGTDILITDHAMGHMDGAQLIRELRARKSKIPIIMISGNPKAREEALAAGATEFLDKHIEMKVLEAHIRSLIHARR